MPLEFDRDAVLSNGTFSTIPGFDCLIAADESSLFPALADRLDRPPRFA